MYEIDPSALKRALECAPEYEPEPDFINPYLRKAVFEPIFREESLTPGQIDYSLFSLEDLHELLDFACEHYDQARKLEAVNEVFCKRPPKREARRAFC